MNMEELKLVVTFKKRLLNLEKGYKELSEWHDKNKMQLMDTHFSNKKIHEKFIESQKKTNGFSRTNCKFIE